MRKQDQFGEHFSLILKEMFRRVGADYDTFDFDKEHWYNDYHWTIEENEDFINWLTDYLYNNSKARKELMSYTRKNKKACRSTASWFNLMWGWTTNPGNTNK